MLSLARSSLATLTSRSSVRVRTFSSWQRKFPKFFKSSSVCVVKDCRAQIEFVIAYRVRRGLQLLILYSRLGEPHTLWRCLQIVKQYFMQYSRAAAISLSAAVIKFNWAKERIKDDEMTRHIHDIDVCHRLKKNCIDLDAPPCDEKMPSSSNAEAFLKFLWSETCWQPFVTLDNLTIWKKQTSEAQSNTLCCYKVYGYFDDVKALSFLQAYLDLETRKTWDQHVLKLEVVESEPESNSDLIYWISKWPRLFSNRDYVYKRRYLIDHKNQLISVVSKATQHPDYPPVKNNWRVQQYWSYLIVKPYQTFKQAGLEFSLTYYDDPGSNLPGGMLIWATVHGMPTYFKRLHEETKKIEQGGGGSLIGFTPNAPTPNVEVDPFEGYISDDNEVLFDPPVEVAEDGSVVDEHREPKLQNVPFPLPPPSDPNKPKLLPRELSQDEIQRSWNEIKSKVKESVEKVSEHYEEINDVAKSEKKSNADIVKSCPLHPPTAGVDASGANKQSSMVWDPLFGTYIVKASQLMNASNSGYNNKDSDSPQILMISEQNLVINAILSLKRVVFKLLFDRIWR